MNHGTGQLPHKIDSNQVESVEEFLDFVASAFMHWICPGNSFSPREMGVMRSLNNQESSY